MRSVTGVIGSAADKIVSMSLSAVPYLPNTPTQFSIQPHLIPLLSSLFSLDAPRKHAGGTHLRLSPSVWDNTSRNIEKYYVAHNCCAMFCKN